MDLVYKQLGNLTGPSGATGEPGSIIFRGSGMPPPASVVSMARDIDYYLDTDTGTIYPFVDDTTQTGTGEESS